MYPTTGNYNINSYAPVDPMDQIQIPVFGYPQQQLPPNAASTSSVAQAQRVQPVAQMNSPGQPVQRSQSTTHPPHPQPGARSARTVSDRRQISTEEMRNDFNRAAPYIPTPINNSARTGLAQPPVVMSPQQLPSSSTRQSNTSVPVMLPNLTTANCQQKQQGPDPVVNNESSKRDRRRKQSIPQHNTPQQDSPVAQHPPRGHLPVARQPQVQPTPPGPPVLQRNALDTLLQQKREAVLEMVLQMDAIALQKMNTYIEYGDDREVFVKFKNLAVDRWYLIYLFKQYYMPIPDRLRGNGAHDNQSWPEDPPGYPLPNKQYPSYERLAKIQMEQNVMYSLRRTQGAQGHISQNLVNTQAQRLPNQAPPTRSPVPPGQMQRPPMPQLLHPQQMQMEQRMHLGHTVHPRQGPGFPANMQPPPSNMHGVPIQFLPHNGPPPTYVQYGPAAQQQQLQQLQQLQQQQQLQQHQIQQQRQMQQQFQHQPQLQPQQQFQNQPQFHQQRMLHNQQLQQHVQHQQQMQHRQHQLHQEQQRQQHQGPVPLAPPNQAPSQPPPTDSYPVVSADLPPPKSALSPGPVTSTEVPEDPVDTKPVVRREAPAPQDQPEQQAEPESMQKPVVRPIESPAVAENPVVAPSTARKRPPKPPKKRIEVITLDDDERPRVKQEVVDSEFQSSSSGRQGTISVKEEPPVRTFTQKEVDEMKEAFRKEMEEKNKQEIDEKVKAAVSIAVANEIKDLKEQFVMLKQASANVQHPETQEPQQTTIPEAVVTTQKPRSPSPSDSVVGRRQRARLRVVESDEENAEASNPIPEKTTSISTPSTNRTRTRPKTRLLMKDSDDDDEMPTPNKRRKRQVESDDDEYREEEEDETISECTASPILSEDEEEEEDSMRDFIEEDDDSDEEEEEEEEEESGELEMRKTATLRKIPKREVSSGRSSRETSETMNSTSGVQKESSASKLSTGVRPQRTAEELEALRKLRAMKARKTREENREKKHKAQLELMEQTPVRRTRGREATVHHPSSPLSEVLLDTIAIFQSKRGSEDDNQASKREKQGKSESVEKQREEQSKSNSESQHRTTSAHKRPIATEKNDELDTHTPSKRVAHSSSVSRPSRVRATPPVAKNRPNQMEMMDRRDKEKEENDKKLVEEIAFLKKKKFLTDGEQLRLRTLEKKVGPSQAQTPKPSSSSSKPSTSSNRIIKQEPRDIPEIPEKKRPPPKFLDPTKGRAFHKMRETNIERIFKILVDGHAGNPEQEAQRIELELATTYTTAAQYRIKSSHKVVQLKREYPPDIVPINKNAVSHERMIAGAAKENCTIAKGKSKIDYRQLSLDDLFPSLAQFKLSSAKLKENAYPLFKPNGRVVQIAETQYTVNKKVFLSNHDLKRSCCRCFKEFQVKNDGSVIREKDICRYHNRNMIRDGKRDTQRKRYQCCNEDFASASLGCKFVDTHVFDQMFTRDLEKFVSTPQPSSPTDPRSKNAFALDCEMVYTLEGSALARLSMVDMKGVKVLDVFIKPPSEVIDPNTEFSGLTLDQVNSATDTLATCHRKLFKYVNSETILIGHSLESDLKAMRVSHTSVIDTAVMYASVTNNKQSLKALSLKLLGKKIQNDNEDAVGHDSLEDALTCVDLIFHGLANPESVVYRNIP